MYYVISTFCILIVLYQIKTEATTDHEISAVCPPILSRSQWQGRKPQIVAYVVVPTLNVVIHHTVTDQCSTEQKCSSTVRTIQNFHIDEMDLPDIGYNFIIGGDGNIYEGVGWHKTGAHTRGYNSRSMGIAFIGNYQDVLPNKKMLEALKNLLNCGVQLGELDKNYRLFGARQVSATASPGTKLFKELKNWSHFVLNP
ncbi:peptidoglycan-recognition protein 2-like [Euwallacea fornicatus]|uniref:peptidoglycan-recognition protein 2-like n=1 Tax=Euwallacea fornicatus TaxID=995702 RepID=UPI00338F3853